MHKIEEVSESVVNYKKDREYDTCIIKEVIKMAERNGDLNDVTRVTRRINN